MEIVESAVDHKPNHNRSVLELLEKLRALEGFMEMSTKSRWGYDTVVINFSGDMSVDSTISKVSVIDFVIGFINNRRVNIDYFNGNGRKWKLKLSIPRNQIGNDFSDGL